MGTTIQQNQNVRQLRAIAISCNLSKSSYSATSQKAPIPCPYCHLQNKATLPFSHTVNRPATSHDWDNTFERRGLARTRYCDGDRQSQGLRGLAVVYPNGYT